MRLSLNWIMLVSILLVSQVAAEKKRRKRQRKRNRF